MQLKNYLSGKVLPLFFYILCMLFINIFLNIYGFAHAGIVYIDLLLAAAILLFLFFEFYRKKKFYDELNNCLEQLDQKYLLCELLPDPAFWEGQMLAEILTLCNKSMNDEIAKYRISSKDYREYIEMWIHEVKTPLASSKLVIENAPDLPSLQSIGEELQELETYLDQALFYARSSSVEKDYIIKAADLSSLVNSALRKNSKLLIRSRFRVTRKLPDYTVYTDQKWIEFILHQIIINAVKYRQEQEPALQMQAYESKEKVILKISDNGIGISASDLPRVCEKGYTGTTGRMYKKSTGMGLYLCRKLCDKLGIGLEITSREGLGTEVFLSFPRHSELAKMLERE